MDIRPPAPTFNNIVSLFYRHIKKNLTLKDIIELSLVSKHCSSIAILKKSEADHLQFLIKNEIAFLVLSAGEGPNEDEFVAAFYKEEYDANGRYETRQFRFNGNMMKLESQTVGDGLKFVYEDFILASCAFANHILGLFKTEMRLEINSDDFPRVTNLFNCCKHISEVSGLIVTDGSLKISEEQLACFMDNIRITQEFYIINCPEMDVHKIIDVKLFHITNAPWFTIRHLSSFRSSTITLIKTAITKFNLLEIVGIWKAGSFENLEVLVVKLLEGDVGVEIIGSVAYFGFSHFISQNNMVKKVTEGKVIRRNDGSEAIILTHKNGNPRKSFRLLVNNGNGEKRHIMPILVGKTVEKQQQLEDCTSHNTNVHATSIAELPLRNFRDACVLKVFTFQLNRMPLYRMIARLCPICNTNRAKLICQIYKRAADLVALHEEISENGLDIPISYEPIFL